MKLFSSPASPFATKVEMAAHVLKIEIEAVTANVANETPDIVAHNPLCKVPCLVMEDGSGLFDSRTIVRWMNRHAGGSLFPQDEQELLAAERMESLADGICDAAVSYMFEARFRPEEKVHVPWQERQWRKVMRGLDHAAQNLPPMGDKIHIGSIALVATLGYLELRYQGKWEEGHAALVQWKEDFFAAHPDLFPLKPTA